MIEFIFWGVLITWIAYIPAANIINREREKPYTGLRRVIMFLYVALFAVIDVTANIFVFSLLFGELPREGLVTTRLKRHILETPQYKWRHGLAYFICRYMVEPWDHDHCSLSKI